MQLHRLIRAAGALAAAACILLALAASAGAVPADNGPPSTTAHGTVAPTVVKETIVRPDDGPGTPALVAIGVGAATALVAAGYIGARLATRNSSLRAG